MSEDEIKAVIASVLADLGIDAPTAKDKGKIMKELMPKVKAKLMVKKSIRFLPA